MNLRGKVAIVTGAGRGIGEAIARKFVQEGAKVVVCDMNEPDVKRVFEDITAQGGKAIGIVMNVSNEDEVKQMVEKTVQEFGTVDILINNAGITRDAMVHKMTMEQWNQVMTVNLTGSFICCQAVIPIMREKNYGKIVNISSTSRFGNVGQANYAASKAGVVGLTRSLARELGSKGINVNAVAPGGIMTDMLKAIPEKLLERNKAFIPLGHYGEAEDIANICLFLASDQASFITGQVIQTDGGMFMC